MPFKFTMLKAAAAALTIAAVSPAFAAGVPVKAATPSYRFELVGPARPVGAKQHVVSARIVRSSDNKPVVGAIVTAVRLDMGPENMAAMTAPVRQLLNSAPGIYVFSFDDSAVWFERAKWALTITATVQGERQPVIGSVVFQAGR
ncbi:MAG: FixH family protein [Alphaproteobacteria bacterium]|nr:FixH family protein [Alphaproteobacteria bacterium]